MSQGDLQLQQEHLQQQQQQQKSQQQQQQQNASARYLRPRKVRRVKNSPIDLYDVKVAPGLDYKHWEPFAREKLKEREMYLTTRRLAKIGEIIKERLERTRQDERSEFERKLKEIEHAFDKETSEYLSRWVSPRITNKKTNLTMSFQRYFRSWKNKWDQSKVSLLCNHLFIPTFNAVYSLFAAMDEQRQFYVALKQMLMARIPIPNSKDRLMIPVGVCVEFIKHSHSWHFNRAAITSLLDMRRARKIGGTQTRKEMLECLDLYLQSPQSPQLLSFKAEPQTNRQAPPQGMDIDMKLFADLSNAGPPPPPRDHDLDPHDNHNHKQKHKQSNVAVNNSNVLMSMPPLPPLSSLLAAMRSTTSTSDSNSTSTMNDTHNSKSASSSSQLTVIPVPFNEADGKQSESQNASNMDYGSISFGNVLIVFV